MTEQLLTAAERWALAAQALEARWRVWGPDGAHIPMVLAIQRDRGDHEFLVKMLATWERFVGSIWLADAGAIVEEWEHLTYYHSAWSGPSARCLPADAHAQWSAELDPFRPLAAACEAAAQQGCAGAIPVEARKDGKAWANSAWSHRRSLEAGNGFQEFHGHYDKYLTPIQLHEEAIAESKDRLRNWAIQEAHQARVDAALFAPRRASHNP